MNVHALKTKKKNINKQLGLLYSKKLKLNKQIKELEEAKVNLKTILHAKVRKET